MVGKFVPMLLSLFVALPAGAALIPLTAKLEASAVVPPSDSIAFGTGTFVFDDVSRILTWAVVVTDVLFEGPETGSAFHGPAAIGFTAPSLASLGLGTLKLGSVDLDDVCIDPAVCEDDLLASLWYLEVTSEGNPEGEIRGQLLPVPLSEPTAFALGSVGLVGLASFSRKKPRKRPKGGGY